MMTYRVVSGVGPNDLTNQVNALLKSGWFLVGGLVVNGPLYAQAMIYEGKKND